MSFAFEVTPEDVFAVLELHGVAESEEDTVVVDAWATVVELEDRITEAVLNFRAHSEGHLAALGEIESILIEDGLLDGPRRVAATLQ